MVQDDVCPPLLVGDFREGVVDDGGEFLVVRFDFRAEELRRQTGHFVVFFGLAAGEARIRASLVRRRTSSMRRLRAMRNIQPRKRPREVIPRLIVDLDEGVLGEVFGELPVAGVAVEEAEEREAWWRSTISSRARFSPLWTRIMS